MAEKPWLKDYFKKPFSLRDGTVSFDIMGPVIKTVTEFYDVAPFPNYRSDDDKASIRWCARPAPMPATR